MEVAKDVRSKVRINGGGDQQHAGAQMDFESVCEKVSALVSGNSVVVFTINIQVTLKHEVASGTDASKKNEVTTSDNAPDNKGVASTGASDQAVMEGRLASKEGSYFLQESRQAVTKLLEKQRNSSASNNAITPIAQNGEIPSVADVLPEVLRHSLPSKIFSSQSENSGSSLSRASKWALKPDPAKPGGPAVSPDALNPLRAYVSLPQVTFGPKRWQLPNSEGAVVASTANDLRQDKYAPINPEKLKAAAAGLTQIGSAFAVATAIVFGGATLIFGLAASRLEVHNTNDIRSKGKDLIQPRFKTLKERLAPLRNRAEEVSKKWHLENEGNLKERPLLFKELSRTLGAKS